MTTVTKFPSKTKKDGINWKVVDENVPTDTMLLLCCLYEEDDNYVVEMGYKSAKTGMFIIYPDGLCMNEHGSPSHYVVLHLPNELDIKMV